MNSAGIKAVQDSQLRVSGTPTTHSSAPIPWVVIGMGGVTYGKEKRIITALKHMPRIQPHFFTSRWENGNIEDSLQEHGFVFTRTFFGHFGRSHFSWTLKNLFFSPRLFWCVWRKYHEHRAQGIIVLAFTSFANALPAIAVLRWFAAARVIFYLGDIPANSWPNRLIARISRHTADAMIANSHAVRRGLEDLGVEAGRVHVAYNGIEFERFARAQPLAWRQQFGWTGDALLVGYAGQFAENKGVRDFIEAAEEVLHCNDRCRFILIGRIDNKNETYNQIAAHIVAQNLSEQVKFVGWLSEMERAYATLDIVVVPSRHEEAGANVVIEAMASGVPVVATRAGGNPELVSDGETGFLVNKRNPQEIAARILQLANDSGLRGHLGELGRKAAKS